MEGGEGIRTGEGKCGRVSVGWMGLVSVCVRGMGDAGEVSVYVCGEGAGLWMAGVR